MSVQLSYAYLTSDAEINYQIPTVAALFYRVTHHVDSNLPLTSKQKFRFGLARSGLARPIRNFVLMSTGGLNQRDVSPCISTLTTLHHIKVSMAIYETSIKITRPDD